MSSSKQGGDAVDYGTAFLESSPDGVLLVDTAGRIVAYNGRFVTMWSLPPEVVSSRSDEAALASVIDKLEKPAEFIARVTYLYEHPAETSFDLVSLKDGRTFERYSAATLHADGYDASVWVVAVHAAFVVLESVAACFISRSSAASAPLISHGQGTRLRMNFPKDAAVPSRSSSAAA